MIRSSLVILFCAAGLCLAQAPQGPGKAPAPAKPESSSPWSIRSHQFPADVLVAGFESKDRGKLKAPKLPAAGAPETAAAAFLKKSHGVLTAYFTAMGYPPPEGSLLAYDPESLMLTARTTQDFHDLLQLLAEEAVQSRTALVGFSVQILEADASAVRRGVEDAGTVTDHAKILTELSALVDQGKGRHAADLQIETRSGQRVRIRRETQRSHATEFSVESDGSTSTTQERHDEGTVFEVDPVVGEDGETIDLNVALTHQTAPPAERWEPAAGRVGMHRVESKATDFHYGRLNTSLTLKSGETKLLAVWKPESTEGAAGTTLFAAFVTTTARRVLPLENPRITELVKAQGEKVIATPKQAPALPDGVPAGMILRRFRATDDMLAPSPAAGGGAGASVGNVDPFSSGAPAQPKLTIQATVLEALRAAGLVFPEGASATLDAEHHILLVRNTPENVEAVRRHLQAQNPDGASKNLAITTHLVQADGALIRRLMAETRKITDHSAAWQSIQEAAAQNKATVLRTVWIETRSGQRALSESRVDTTTISAAGGNDPAPHNCFPAPPPAQPQKAASEAGPAANAAPNATATAAPPVETPAANSQTTSRLFGEHELEQIGTSVEVDPVLAEDGRTIDLNLALNYDYAPPTRRFTPEPGDGKTLRTEVPGTDFHRAEFNFATTLLDGAWRLAGVWKPDGTPEFEGKDVLQAVFVRVNVIANAEPKP